MDTEYYQTLADQELDRTINTTDAGAVAEHVSRAQIRALLALASAVDRLAKAVEEHD